MNDNLKVCIYTICKNEEKFIDRWYESVKDADYICVLDTGSTDNTVEKLKKYNIITDTKIINPWRFDVARNESMKLIPKDTDVCFCIDIDEVIKPGWKEEIKKVWKKDTNRLRYTFLGQLDKHGNPTYHFINNKIHSLNGYEWKSPLHEYLVCKNNIENTILNENIVVYHRPDETKSRAAYLDILKQAVIDNPNDDRCLFYLGKEYMIYNKYNDAIKTFLKHINMPTSTWDLERSASMRYLAKCYDHINNYEESKKWLENAIKETPNIREPYVDLAKIEYIISNYDNVIDNCHKALKITEKEKNYTNEPYCWDHTIYELLALSLYFKKEYQEALKYINLAINISPDYNILKTYKNIIEKDITKKGIE